jgi:hypothetical protein
MLIVNVRFVYLRVYEPLVAMQVAMTLDDHHLSSQTMRIVATIRGQAIISPRNRTETTASTNGPKLKKCPFSKNQAPPLP